MMKAFRKQAFERSRETYADKAKGSIVEHLLSSTQLVSIQDAFVPEGADAKRSISVTAALGHRLAFLLSYAGALRCESTRNLELSDLSTLFVEKEGPKGCTLLVLSLGQGKTNHFGRLDRTAIMRHRLPEMCAVGALGLYLFCRFHMRHEPFPSFARSGDFFYNKVIQPMTKGKMTKKTKKWDGKGKEKAIPGEEEEEEETEEDGDTDTDVDSITGAGAGSGAGADAVAGACAGAGANESVNDKRVAAARKEATAVHHFFDNAPAGGVNTDGELVARAAAGPCISNGPISNADRERLAELNLRSTEPSSSSPGTKAIGYDAQRTAFREALERANVPSTRVTHVGRAAAASMVAQSGKNLDDQLRKHGHWNKDAMTNCYIDSFRESSRTTIHKALYPSTG